MRIFAQDVGMTAERDPSDATQVIYSLGLWASRTGADSRRSCTTEAGPDLISYSNRRTW